MKKAQMTIEFLFMIAIAVVFIFGFLYIFSDLYNDSVNDRMKNTFDDFGRSVQSELIDASQMSPGYRRQIMLPEKLGGFPYQVRDNVTTVTFDYGRGLSVYLVPSHTGTLVKGMNTIRNTDGTICVNC